MFKATPSAALLLILTAVWIVASGDPRPVMTLKSTKVTTVGRRSPGARRAKRSLFPSDAQRQIVDKHNALRRLEGATDMEHMVWNGYLAAMAEDWAKRCVWEHGQPDRPAGEPPFDPLGQNLYVTTGPMDAAEGIQLFYDEKAYYDYDTGACSTPPCGHYTQVVWAGSREVGCAWAFCPTMGNIAFTDANYMVCNYGPAGNMRGEKPFSKGPPCTQCETGEFWCDAGLCRRDCTAASATCQCKADCKNSGTLRPATCSCSCAAGWTGVDCSRKCEDVNSYCGANPGWPRSWCDKDYVRQACPAMCELCSAFCTNPDWVAVPGRKLGSGIQTSLQYDKDPERYCKPQCVADDECVSFDSYYVAGRISCYFSSAYTPLDVSAPSTHWEYRRTCNSQSGYSCSFLYVGVYSMTQSVTAVTAADGADCLFKCANSDACQAAAYSGTQCQHAVSEATAISGRIKQPGWSQYLKRECSKATPPGVQTTKRTPQPATKPGGMTTPPKTEQCSNGGSNVWKGTLNVHVPGGLPQNDVQDLDGCRQECLDTVDCTAIDFKSSARGTKCWLLIGVQGMQLKPESGVLHEDLTRCSAACR